METSHKVLASLVICIMFIQVEVGVFAVGMGTHSLGNVNRRGLLQTDPDVVDCPTKCDARCALAGRADRCIRYCLICCDRCHCVPSGTYGQKDHECDCYVNMKNSKGGNKCP